MRPCRLGLVMALAAAPLLLACSVRYPGSTADGAYSGAFWHWINQSMALRAEVEQAIADGAAGDWRGIVEQQLQINRLLLEANPTPYWAAYHGRILAALRDFQTRSEALLAEGDALPPDAALERARRWQEELRKRVVDCYAQSPRCA